MVLENEGMDKLFGVINKLQDACAKVDPNIHFDLPQIAVIGCQSAGKSSVLESFVGRDFIPRGSGIVTRCPLIFQILKGPEEYGEFLSPHKIFKDFNEIREEIQARTDQIAGSAKGVSSTPINLRIYSPNVISLTLVDLPGLTKVAIDDQAPDIVSQIEEMNLKIISKENCLILAVTPAGDLANSDALALAAKADPKRLRTIGVITKIDLMSKGTNARNELENKIHPLVRGYQGVVNRSQKDIENQKDIKAAIKSEREFFLKHDSYRDMVDRLGTPYLQSVLCQQLFEHIRNTLPNLKSKLRAKCSLLTKEIENFEKLHPNDVVSKKLLLLKDIQKLQAHWEAEIGSFDCETADTNELSSGAKICQIFQKKLPNEMNRIDCNDDLNRIVVKIQNIYGIRGCTFTPHIAFESLVKSEIHKLNEPIYECIGLVLDELLNAVKSCVQRISRMKLRVNIENLFVNYINLNKSSYVKNILSLTEMELAYLNTNHEDFKTLHDAGRDNIQSGTQNDTQSNTENDIKSFEKKVIKTGNLTVENPDVANGSLQTCFVTLTLGQMTGTTENLKFEISLIGIKIDVIESNGLLILSYLDGRIVYENHKTLTFICLNSDELRLWEESFKEASQHNEQLSCNEQAKKKTIPTSLNSTSDKTVQVINKSIQSYMRIVKKTLCNMVPKAITLYIVKDLNNFVNNTMLVTVLDAVDDYIMMEPHNSKKYEFSKKMLSAYENALKIIDEMYTGNNTQ